MLLKIINYEKLKRKILRQKVFKSINLIWIVLVILMGVRTIRRNYDWYSDETLYESGISVCPAKGK